MLRLTFFATLVFTSLVANVSSVGGSLEECDFRCVAKIEKNAKKTYKFCWYLDVIDRFNHVAFNGHNLPPACVGFSFTFPCTELLTDIVMLWLRLNCWIVLQQLLFLMVNTIYFRYNVTEGWGSGYIYMCTL
jgi:hypothetical protein